MNYKLKPIPTNIVVHTPTGAEAKELLEILHENGYKWKNGTDSLLDPIYYTAREGFCIEDGKRLSSYIFISSAIEDKCTVISLAEFKERYVEQEKPQPKFKVGDKVKIVNVRNPMMLNEIGIIEEHYTKNSPLYKVKWGEDSSTFIEDVYLEPYAEPETKPIEEMETKEKESGEKGNNSENSQLDLCELLSNGDLLCSLFYSPAFGEVSFEENRASEGEIEIETKTEGVIFVLDQYGRIANEGGVCIIWPNKDLYEQYPLDPQKAWIKWQEEQMNRKTYIQIYTVGSDGLPQAEVDDRYYFRTPAVRDKCIEEIQAIIEKYNKA